MDSSKLGGTHPIDAVRGAFCTGCGRAAGTGRFCAHCGTELLSSGDAHQVLPSQQDGREAPTALLSSAAPTNSTYEGAESDPEQWTTSMLAGDDQSSDQFGFRYADEPAPVDAAAPVRRGRTLIAAAVAVVAVIAAAVLGYGYLSGSAVRTALAGSTEPFNRVINSVAAAKDSSEVAQAADTAQAATRRIDNQLRALSSADGEEAGAVRAQLEAEKGVLVAVAGLTQVASEPLTTWGDAHEDLTAALKTEDDTRADLARHQNEAAGKLADTGAMLSKLTAAVGPALVEDATAESTRLLKSLQAAASTADLRKLGDAASPEQAAVAAAAQALPAGDGKQVLTGYATALDALAALSKLDAENTGGWGGTRARLAQTFGQVAAAAGSTGGSNVRVVLDTALGSADKVVQKAAAAIADWKAKTDAAVKARQSDLENLQSYSSFFRSQAKTYEQLRQDLSTFVARVEDPTADVSYYEAYTFLSQAAQDRQDVRDLMVGMDVPPGARSAHQEVLGAIDRAIAAVQSAYDGLEQSQDCYYDDCPYYRDTAGWQRFQSESDAISKSYTGAIQRWEAAVAAEKVSVTNRALPAKPAV